MAVGTYNNLANTDNAFVIQESKGTWGAPVTIPGVPGDANEGNADANYVACPSVGNCSVAGDYNSEGATSIAAASAVFVVDEVHGTWHDVSLLGGLAPLANASSGVPVLASLSCAAPGDCALGGIYFGSTPPSATAVSILPFLAIESDGVWGAATRPAIPGLPNASAWVTSVDCPAAGHCIAGGAYAPSLRPLPHDGFLVTQAGTTWSAATTSPVFAPLALACPSAGNCTAAGRDSKNIAAVEREVNGKWGKPAQLAGAAGLAVRNSKATSSQLSYLACPAAASCTAAGSFSFGPAAGDDSEAIIADEVNGTWPAAQAAPGTEALNTGKSALPAGLACASAGSCAAVGQYATSAGSEGAFLLAEIPVWATSTTIGLSHQKITYGKEQAEKISVRVSSHGTPAGQVTVKSGHKTVCTITLKSGAGSCTLTARQFAKDTYLLVASYPATAGFAASASKAATLTVMS